MPICLIFVTPRAHTCTTSLNTSSFLLCSFRSCLNRKTRVWGTTINGCTLCPGLRLQALSNWARFSDQPNTCRPSTRPTSPSLLLPSSSWWHLMPSSLARSSHSRPSLYVHATSLAARPHLTYEHHQLLDVLARDTHYKYFVLLIIPTSSYFVIANWVGWQYYQNS